jgi:hypothetical protein
MEPVNTDNGQGISNSPMQGNQMPVFQAKKKVSKLLTIGLPVALGSVLLICLVLFFVLRGAKTSNEVLANFSSATSSLNTKSLSLSSDVSAASYSDSVDIDTSKKDFDNALGEFDSATAKLKSDKKDLKSAAENYSSALKEYRDNTVSVAVDSNALQKIFNKASEIEFNQDSTSSEDAYLLEVDRIKNEYSSLAKELKDLQIKNQKVKDLRDTYAMVMDQLVNAMGRLRDAFVAKDTEAMSNIQSELTDMEYSSDVSAKEKAVKSLLSAEDSLYKKVEDARKALNNQIDMVNSKR